MESNIELSYTKMMLIFVFADEVRENAACLLLQDEGSLCKLIKEKQSSFQP
jgi:hypothetical protein